MKQEMYKIPIHNKYYKIN